MAARVLDHADDLDRIIGLALEADAVAEGIVGGPGLGSGRGVDDGHLGRAGGSGPGAGRPEIATGEPQGAESLYCSVETAIPVRSKKSRTGESAVSCARHRSTESRYIGRRTCAALGVATAAALQVVASFQLTFFPSLGMAMIAAGFSGGGYGAYMAVDQALITRVLPDALSRAKDLGIMNVGSVGPQAMAPLGASLIIGSLGGYSVLYGTAGVTTLIGAVLVYRIKSVR